MSELPPLPDIPDEDFVGHIITRDGFIELMRRASTDLVIEQLIESAGRMAVDRLGSDPHPQIGDEVNICKAELLRRLT